MTPGILDAVRSRALRPIDVLASVAVVVGWVWTGWSGATFGSTFLRDPVPVSVLVAAAVLGVAGVWERRRTLDGADAAALAACVWAWSSLAWTSTPAATFDGAGWATVWAAAWVSARARPPAALVAATVVLASNWLRSMDVYLHLDDVIFMGVWFNKNVQGAHLLLVLPLLARASFVGRAVSPYVAVVLGAASFTLAMTFSVSTQVLGFASIVAVAVVSARVHAGNMQRRRHALAVVTCATGAVLAWGALQPPVVQVLGVGIGQVEGGTAHKSGLGFTLGHRLEMLTYAASAGVDAFPLGTGFASGRDLYPSLKRQSGLGVADVHNAFAQSWMEVGPLGLVAFVVPLFVGIGRAWSLRRWALFASLFTFTGYLAFDVAAYYPGLMATAFLLAGVAAGTRPAARILGTTQRWSRGLAAVGAVTFVASLALTSIVAASCTAQACTPSAWTLDEATAHRIAGGASADDRVRLYASAVAWNPSSFWAHGGRWRAGLVAGEDDAVLAQRASALVQQFPYAALWPYVEWRDRAIRAGDGREALRAAREGLLHYRDRAGPLGLGRP